MFHDLPPAEMQKYREIDPTGDRQQCVATSRNYSMCRSGAWRHIVSSSLSTTCPKSDRVRLPSRSTVQSRVMRDGSNDRRELSIQSDRSRSEEHTYELQSIMRISYAVLCLNKKITKTHHL